jgi:hypothetical protein
VRDDGGGVTTRDCYTDCKCSPASSASAHAGRPSVQQNVGVWPSARGAKKSVTSSS